MQNNVSNLQYTAFELQDDVNDLEEKRRLVEGQINALEGILKTKQHIDKLPVKISRPINYG